MRITMLSGGVGGARMVRGFAALEVDLSVVVNVADDERVHGLYVSPDLDTVIYTLAGIEGPAGWGRAEEAWTTMEELDRFPVDNRFRLGDRDLATNLFRTGRLLSGASLSEITRQTCEVFGVETVIVPVSDDPIRTELRVAGTETWFDFQTYFVRRQHRDPVDRIRYVNAETARPAPTVVDLIAGADAVVIGPSNPLLSIRPILAVPGIEEALRSVERILAVSPLIGGEAVKGPAARLLAGLGHPPGNAGVVDSYGGLLTDLVVDHADADHQLEVRTWITDTRIPDLEQSVRLAKEICAWLE